MTQPSTAQTADQKIPERDQIDERYKWRLEPIYPHADAWEADLARLETWLPALERYPGRLAESADLLLDCLQTRDRIVELTGRLAVYTHLKRDEDTRLARFQGLSDRIQRLATTIGEKLSFLAPELIAMDPRRLEEFLAHTPQLEVYRHFLDDIVRARAHTLSPREEEIIAMTADLARGPYNIFSMLDNADLVFPTIRDTDGRDIELTKARYARLMESPDRGVRKAAYTAFYGTYKNYKNTFAAALSSQVKRSLFYTRIRRYDTALHAALDTYRIPVAVFENLMGTVNEHLDSLHRYMALRKRVLKLDTLCPYDTAVPLVPEVEMRFAYEDAVELVKQALAPMGEAYGSILQQAFSDGWIDVHETAGKRSGAYSSGTYGTSPYVLLNLNRTLDSVFTLAHELGHALHTYLAHRHQPFVYSDYAIFVAEVASTASESLLMSHLLERAQDRRERLYLLNHWLDQIRGTFFNQVMFAEFEWDIHRQADRGQPLTHESLSETFGELYRRYHGPQMADDELGRCGWSRIPHFYYNFYVYQYATGYAAASTLARRILRQEPGAAESYLAFLRSGGSDYPIELLRRAGVDMTRPEPVTGTLELFDQLTEEMTATMASS